MLLLPDTGLWYPQGLIPVVDPTHPAAGPKLRYSGAASLSGFVNLMTGAPATNSGTITQSLTPVGPVLTNTTSGSYAYAAGIGFAATAITFGAVVLPTASVAYGVIFNNAGNVTNTTASLFELQAKIPTLVVASTSIQSGITLTLNTPYFLAVSYNGLVANFAVANLTNGVIQTASISSTHTIGSPGVNQLNLAGTSTASTQLGGGLATVMYSTNNYLSLVQLAQWAADPWGFWYPPDSTYSYIGSSPAATVNGTLNVTAANATLSAAGLIGVIGSTSVTAASATLSATGLVGVLGSLTVTAANATLSASGTITVPVVGTLSTTAAATTLSSSGLLGILGTLTKTTASVTLVASGTISSVVTITATLSAQAQSATLSSTAFTFTPQMRPAYVGDRPAGGEWQYFDRLWDRRGIQ